MVAKVGGRYFDFDNIERGNGPYASRLIFNPYLERLSSYVSQALANDVGLVVEESVFPQVPAEVLQPEKGALLLFVGPWAA